MKKKVGALLLTFCMCLISLLTPIAAYAETAEPTDLPTNTAESSTTLVIRIGDKIYENITNGSVIVGDFDLDNLEFWVESVNGNKLENVGSKSTATDSMGRNPLEVASVPADGRLTVTLIYHAEDDPVAANQAYGFSVAGIVFTNAEENTFTKPTVGKVSGLTATAKSKSLKLAWKKSSVNGYELQYSTSKSFSADKTTTVKVAKSKTSYTIKKLKGNKKYYVRIRGYKTYTDDLGNNGTVYGNWSKIVSKTTKK